MTREQIQHEGDRPLPCAAQEAFRCRPDALSDDEKTILSAMALQKGEAEAGEIFRESPEHLRDYTILKGVNSYAALGRYYLATETTVPEELYEYMDLGALGCRYEDEHPGVFIGSDYSPCGGRAPLCVRLHGAGGGPAALRKQPLLTTRHFVPR